MGMKRCWMAVTAAGALAFMAALPAFAQLDAGGNGLQAGPATNGASAAAIAGNAIVAKLLRHAAVALANNPWDSAPLAVQPTVTAGTTATPGLTQVIRPNTATYPYAVVGGGVERKNPGASYLSYTQAATFGTPAGGAGAGSPANLGAGNTGYAGAEAYAWSRDMLIDSANFDLLVSGNASIAYMILASPPNQPNAPLQYIGTHAGQLTSTGSGVGYFNVNFGSGGKALRRVRIEGSQATAFSGVDIGPNDTVYAPDTSDDIRAVIVGNSIPCSTGAIYANNGAMPVMAKKLGWVSAQQMCIGGTDWVNNGGYWNQSYHLSDLMLTGACPDVVVVGNAGYNDFSLASSVQAAMQADFQGTGGYLAQCPTPDKGGKTVYVVLGPWPGSTGPSTQAVAEENAEAAAVTAIGSRYVVFEPFATASPPYISGTGFVGATTASGNSSLYVFTDGVHVYGDAGATYLASVDAQLVINAVQKMSTGPSGQ